MKRENLPHPPSVIGWEIWVTLGLSLRCKLRLVLKLSNDQLHVHGRWLHSFSCVAQCRTQHATLGIKRSWETLTLSVTEAMKGKNRAISVMLHLQHEPWFAEQMLAYTGHALAQGFDVLTFVGKKATQTWIQVRWPTIHWGEEPWFWSVGAQTLECEDLAQG